MPSPAGCRAVTIRDDLKQSVLCFVLFFHVLVQNLLNVTGYMYYPDFQEQRILENNFATAKQQNAYINSIMIMKHSFCTLQKSIVYHHCWKQHYDN